MFKLFDPEKFVEEQIKEIKKNIGKEKALVAVSGGVDSATCVVLTHKAISGNLVCITIDDAFMREGEPERVAEILTKEPFNVPTKIVNARERFIDAMKGLKDAEDKRKVFRETFYKVLSETAKTEECPILVQGTIRADIIETVGGIKTQHNVLEQIGLNPIERYGFKIVEPLATLYKWQVKMVARILKLPSEISERQPFPGPGLSVRLVGEIHTDKLEVVKKSTAIVERELSKYAPSQYFAVIIDNEIATEEQVSEIQQNVSAFLNTSLKNVNVKIFVGKATGVKKGERCYGKIVAIKVETNNEKLHCIPIQNLISLQASITEENPEVVRILYAVKDLPERKPYVIGIRAIQTRDFLTANVSEIPWSALSKIAEKIIGICKTVSTVYYDITPKPPATIEME